VCEGAGGGDVPAAVRAGRVGVDNNVPEGLGLLGKRGVLVVVLGCAAAPVNADDDGRGGGEDVGDLVRRKVS
jgi:hypothetical protein